VELLTSRELCDDTLANCLSQDRKTLVVWAKDMGVAHIADKPFGELARAVAIEVVNCWEMDFTGIRLVKMRSEDSTDYELGFYLRVQ
jgi:hypothetical protein